MDKKELEERISRLKEETKAKRSKRVLKVTAGLVVAYFVAFCILENTPKDFNDFFMYCLTSVVLAVLHFGINEVIFEDLFRKKESEERELKELQKQLLDIKEKEIDEYIKKYKKE